MALIQILSFWLKPIDFIVSVHYKFWVAVWFIVKHILFAIFTLTLSWSRLILTPFGFIVFLAFLWALKNFTFQDANQTFTFLNLIFSPTT